MRASVSETSGATIANDSRPDVPIQVLLDCRNDGTHHASSYQVDRYQCEDRPMRRAAYMPKVSPCCKLHIMYVVKSECLHGRCPLHIYSL